MNKFEHVRRLGFGDWGLGVSLYDEVQCIMGNGHMGPHVDGQTELTTLPSPLCRRVVIKQLHESPKILN